MAELLQVVEPLIASFDPASPIFLIHRAYLMYLGIPVLVEKTHKELLHGHLGHSAHIQVRQHAGDVVQQDPVAPDDVEIFRGEIFFVVIQDIGNAVHRHSCLSGPGNALHDQVHFRGSADHCILLLLDRGDDLTEDRAFIPREILGQELVVSHHVRIKEVHQPVVSDLIGALALQIDLTGPFILYSITAVSGGVLIVNGCDGSAPVDDHGFKTVFRDADPAHIV